MYSTGKYSTELTCFDVNNYNIFVWNLYLMLGSWSCSVLRQRFIKLLYLKQVVDSNMDIYDYSSFLSEIFLVKTMYNILASLYSLWYDYMYEVTDWPHFTFCDTKQDTWDVYFFHVVKKGINYHLTHIILNQIQYMFCYLNLLSLIKTWQCSGVCWCL